MVYFYFFVLNKALTKMVWWSTSSDIDIDVRLRLVQEQQLLRRRARAMRHDFFFLILKVDSVKLFVLIFTGK